MLQHPVATDRRKVWELCSKYNNDVATGCCNRQEEGMGIVFQNDNDVATGCCNRQEEGMGIVFQI